MRLADIESLTDTPPDRLVHLSVDLWAHAVLLGAARQRQGGTSQRSDRGRHNAHVDCMGAFGELLLLKLIEPLDAEGAALAHFRTHLYLTDGAAAHIPDLMFTDADTRAPVGIDAKTFDCDGGKRYFAINDGKHTALRGRCEAYFCVLARPFGRVAAIARLVPYADVDPAREAFPEDRWFVGNLLSRGSPSRNVFLDKFLADYFTNRPDLAELRKKPYPRLDIMAALAQPACAEALGKLIPALDLTAAMQRAREWAEAQDSADAEKKSKAAAKRAVKRMALQAAQPISDTPDLFGQAPTGRLSRRAARAERK